MSVSQNLLAFISTGALPGKAQSTSAGPAEAGQAGAASFADILSEQQPVDVQALMHQLGEAEGEAEGDATEKLLDLAELAADGKNLPAGSGLRAMAERGGQAENQQPAQRNLEMTPAAAEGKAALAGKLAETLEALGGRQPAADKDSGEGLLRPGAQTQAAAQGALGARPVLAASQTLNVPFGQAGWGDAVMDKMVWMSSQNLRSVNIRLDPADLGPLEINIQTRGQEHQVQFVTQNPSVREALEAQMFRLREAFSQQGMNLVDVSVGDSAVDQQTHHNEEGAREGSNRGRVTGSQTLEADEAGMMLASAAVSQAQSTRLIDYYA
jgi:flagellar hook-length control protein FliK